MANHETGEQGAIPQFSVGLDYDNPLADAEGDVPISNSTATMLFGLDLGVVEPTTVTPKGRETFKETHFFLGDGSIYLSTTTMAPEKAGGMPSITERAVTFHISDPLQLRGDYFLVVLADYTDPDLVMRYKIEDYGVVEDKDMPGVGMMFAEAFVLNALVRLDEAPDSLPQVINDGTLQSLPGMAEPVAATLGAIAETGSIDIPGVLAEELAEVFKPRRVLPLGEKMARKVRSIIEPIIQASLDA